MFARRLARLAELYPPGRARMIDGPEIQCGPEMVKQKRVSIFTFVLRVFLQFVKSHQTLDGLPMAW